MHNDKESCERKKNGYMQNQRTKEMIPNKRNGERMKRNKKKNTHEKKKKRKLFATGSPETIEFLHTFYQNERCRRKREKEGK